MTKAKLQKGVLLISEPAIIGDATFGRCVVLLADHGDEGSIGFILNKPLSYTINDLIPEIEASFEIYNGGPVEQDNLYFIHTIPQLIPKSVEISQGVFWGGDFETVKRLINEKAIHREEIRFFLGYSGWGSTQLDYELTSNSWIVTPNNYHTALLSKSSPMFWKEKITELGGDYVIWSNAPENPILN
ncbi:YqgE/AlgH family protein [Flavobacterium aciduliphilum]|uniref:Putative transcriptional regulator n=1 Tax=Flavobacterium aciduliphilum TaxID=1101402 RepID=A0A328YZ63_9FLAO|nr:YqgE/AlgH family protein [Flavobacterium aciduliphilum]RAR75847.1 putative transcriptional regulator [Flavobacterium aciduliphilum]